jgi:class 3 adenylate cyclase
MAALPTGTVTFLFTDIEGSTALLQRPGDGRYAEIRRNMGGFSARRSRNGGQEIDTHGDALLVAFSRARDAVAAAVSTGANSRSRIEPLSLCTSSTRTPPGQDERL